VPTRAGTHSPRGCRLQWHLAGQRPRSSHLEAPQVEVRRVVCESTQEKLNLRRAIVLQASRWPCQENLPHDVRGRIVEYHAYQI
jgi:hypothetical protein